MYSKEELKNLKLEFWESFAAFCEVQPYLRGRKKIWTLYDTKVKDAWIPVRIEMDEDWYLVGLPKTSLSGLTVRM